MANTMQPGKRYRLRPDGDRRFVEGYFFDNRLYDGPGTHIGNVESDGSFRYLPSNARSVPGRLHDLTGKVHGLRIRRQNGTGFDLVAVPEEI